MKTTDTLDSTKRTSEKLSVDIRADPGRHTVLTGDRPTGYLHLGHFLGSLQNRVRLQDAGLDVNIVIADYQVIADRAQGNNIEHFVHEMVADYLAAGIDPSRTKIFVHSAVPELNQLMVPFLSLVSVSELERNPTVKVELAQSGRTMSGLLLTYPIHQAADILACRANVVPVGKDQLPHIEVSRLIARRFNERYSDGSDDALVPPQALLSEFPSVLGTDGEKMSKSRSNAVPLGADADETARIIRRMKTDSIREIYYSPTERPEISSLLEVAAHFQGSTPDAVARDASDGSGTLKRVVTEAVNEGLRSHRERRAELVRDPHQLSKVLAEGTVDVREIAAQTLRDVNDRLGMKYW